MTYIVTYNQSDATVDLMRVKRLRMATGRNIIYIYNEMKVRSPTKKV